MKRQYYIWLSMLFCFWFVEGCNDDDSTGNDTSGAELHLSALIDGMTAEETAYRFQGGQEVGIWLSTTDVSGKLANADGVHNMRFSQSAGGLVAEPRATWNNRSTINVYAYAPYDREAQDAPNAYPFQLNLRQDTVSLTPDGNRQSGFLWTKHAATYTSEPLLLSFHHLMSKIILHVKSNTSMPGSLIGGQLSVCNTQTAANIDLGTGTVSPVGAKGNVVARELQDIPSGYEMAREVIIVPQTIHVGEQFLDIFTLGNYSCVWNADKELVFESGKQIVMEVVIDEGECHVRIKDISPWKEGQSPILGEAVEDLPTFKVLDFYDRDGIQGIVIDVDETGTHGWIVSMDEVELAWGTAPMGTYFPSAYDRDNAQANLNAVLAVDPDLKNYPAMKWCNDKNVDGVTGWVLPAHNVVKKFARLISNPDTWAQFNQAIRNSSVANSSPVNIDWNSWNDYYYASSTLSMTDNVRNAGCSMTNNYWYGTCYVDANLLPQEAIFYVRAFREF